MPDVIPLSQAPAGAANPVDVISALLDAERVTPDSAQTEPAAQPATAQDDAQAEEYQPSENAEVEGDDAKTEEAADATSDVAEIPLDQLEAIELEVTVKGEGGKDVTEKLPIKELKAGYMRNKDYSQKTAQLAKQRAEVGEVTRQAVAAERAQFEQLSQQYQAALLEFAAPELKNVDWNDLSLNDPLKYIQLKQRAEAVASTLNSIKAKQSEVKSKQEADARQAQLETAQKTWATLEADVPNWNEDTYKASLKAAESVGYTEQEVGAWLDPRAIKLLHKAHLYDQLNAGKPPVSKKVVAVPKAVKPGATSGTTASAQRANAAKEQLRKGGKVEDLAAFLSTRM